MSRTASMKTKSDPQEPTRLQPRQNETQAGAPSYEGAAPRGAPRPNATVIRKSTQVVMFLTTVLQLLIGFRVFLKLIAANPQSGFANFIYSLSAPFLAPFAGLTAAPAASGAVLEISSLIAMAVYAILGWLAIYMIRLTLGR